MRPVDLVGTALRNLRRQKLRSALTIFAVVIGATSVTIMLALVTGARDFFLSQFEANGQARQVVVTAATNLDYRAAQSGGGNGPAPTAQQGGQGSGPQATPTPTMTDALVSKIKAVPHVINLTPTTQAGILDSILYGTKRLQANPLNAYDPNGTIKQQIVAGRDLSELEGAGEGVLTHGPA